ncbi:MAG: GGDEF domain-containing protein [Mariprofundales bacterium]|nr:GGDEF domain-containing protein [Mariprofundales bacterium]
MTEAVVILARLIDDLDELRPFVLAASKGQDTDLRSILRRMASAMDQLQQQPAVPVGQYQRLKRLLSRMLDAEHGSLLSGHVGRKLSDEDWDELTEHVELRRVIVDQAQHDIPLLQQTLARCGGLIGEDVSSDDDPASRGRRFEMGLREHLRADVAMRAELNALISVMRDSLESLATMLDSVGENSPELSQIKHLLEQDLPEDPEAARQILQQAREELLSAGSHIVEASNAVQSRMQEQVEQMSLLTEQLKKAEFQARNDPLTGLSNRRRLAEFLRDMDTDVASFVMLDIDFFKKVNDQYGHDAGDEVLTDLAEILLSCVRECDMVARLGGEEFCVVFPDGSLDVATDLSERLRMAVEVHDFKTSAGPIPVTISLGVAERYAEEANSAWIKRADEALYQAKMTGRNRVQRAE